jgi:hypothetical protein
MLATLAVSSAWGATLAQWLPVGGGNSDPGVSGGTQVAATSVAPGVSADPLFSRSAWWGNGTRLPHGHVTRNAAADPDVYVEFGLVPEEAMALVSVSYDRRSYTSGGATFASIRWSVDGFAADLDVVPVDPALPTDDVFFDLSSTPVLDGPVTLRVSFWGATDDDWVDLDVGTGLVVEGDVYTFGFADGDGDGFGDPAAPGAGPGFVADNTDCDDQRDDVHPLHPPIVGDGGDNDCSQGGVGDECHPDADGDGDATATLVDGSQGCAAPGESNVAGSDCDDGDPARFTGNPELCNGLDDDCDGRVDTDAVDAPRWHLDADSDGYGASGAGEASCDPVPGSLLDASDCDDTRDDVSPAGVEIPGNAVDEDCDGVAAGGTGDTPGETGGESGLLPRDPGCRCAGAGVAGTVGWQVGLVAMVAARRRWTGVASR